MSLTLTDLFAGAGGSSTGATHVPGVEVYVAANHWQRAVDVHNANHPDALHVCADVSQINPRRFPRTDILWASPECTNHSIAKGRRLDGAQPDLFGDTLPDEAAERSRATMWDVVRFTEAHRYRAVIVENVIEIRRWQPFKAWLHAMHSLGYLHQEVYLNSMHAQAAGLPAPQSRDRIYVVFWKKGERKPDLERWTSPPAYCPRCERVVSARQHWKRPERPWGRYRSQYLYACPACHELVEPGWLPAAAAIDWSIPGTRIGDRAKPLAERTRRRIAAGIARYWRPLAVEAAGNTYDAASPRHPAHGDPNGYYRAWPLEEALRTLHASESKALVVSYYSRDDAARPAGEPMGTVTAEPRHAVCQPPFIAELRGGGSDARGVDQPLATVTAGGQHHALVAPYHGTAESARPAADPLGALTTRDRYALITRHYSSAGAGAEMTTPATEALRTLTTTAQQSIVTPADLEAAEVHVDDCLFRMLEPHEVAAGMAFPHDYIWEGTRRERVRMAGNAVTPPAARDLIAAVVEAITGEAVTV